MLVAPYLVLFWAMLVLGSTLATPNMLTVFQFPVDEVDGKYDYIEYTIENTQLTAFSICFYFKPTYQLNPYSQTLLQIPDFLKLGLYKDSVGGWLEIEKERIIFDFPFAIHPRIWNSFRIQQTSSERKIWHENQTIYTENMINPLPITFRYSLNK